jgi:cell wall-associated NlpC family hydrolase
VKTALAATSCCLLLPVLVIGATTGSLQVAARSSDSTGNFGGGLGSDAGPTAAAAVSYALAQLGTPYLWGGEGPGGFDCSGLVQAAYRAAGVSLARTAQAQYDNGPPISNSQPLQPGDLVFFGSDTGHVSHVGIAINETEMVDAPHTGAAVRIEDFHWSDYLGATRPTEPNSRNAPSPSTP